MPNLTLILTTVWAAGVTVLAVAGLLASRRTELVEVSTTFHGATSTAPRECCRDHRQTYRNALTMGYVFLGGMVLLWPLAFAISAAQSTHHSKDDPFEGDIRVAFHIPLLGGEG